MVALIYGGKFNMASNNMQFMNAYYLSNA